MKKKILFSLITLLLCSFNTYSQFNSASVLLPNGNITICGGTQGQATISSNCTIFLSTPIVTPSGGETTITTNLTTSRTNHTMTLLPDGRILVAGGYININFNNPNLHFPKFLISTGTPTNTAEICLSSPPYTCTAISNMMPTPRAGHTATLLSYGPDAGNILICGGQIGANTVTNTCEIFITSTTQFKSGPSMTGKRMGQTASLLSNGKVLMSGGITDIYTSSFNFSNTQELYDPQTNSFSPSPEPLFQTRAYHSAVVLNNGNVLIIGGYNENNGKDLLSIDGIQTQSQQGQGSWGFVETIEMFDKDGARVPIEQGQIKTMPYRISSNFSMLKPDGSVITFGGRGNIPVTYITPSINFLGLHQSPSSILNLNWPTSISDPFGSRTTTISTGTLYFQQNIKLSRDITGRILNGNLFLSPQENLSEPRVEVNNFKWYATGPSTSSLDGVSIGWIPLSKGEINTVLTLDDPSKIYGSQVVFEPLTGLQAKDISGSGHFNVSPNSLQSGQNGDIVPNNSTMTVTINSQLPKIYQGAIVRGTITITGMLIATPEGANSFQATITNATAQVTDLTVGNDGNISWKDVKLENISGTVTCSTNTCTFPRDFGGSLSSIQFGFSFTSDKVDLSGTEYKVSKSTVVLRDIVFSDITEYYPKTSEMKFNDGYITTKDNNGNIVPLPLFDLNGAIRLDGIPITIGGRNCEGNPSTDCNRNNPTFNSSSKIFELFDFFGEQWLDFGKLNFKRANHTTTVLTDKTVLVCGGNNELESYDTCELYYPQINQWVVISTMTQPRSYHRATLLPNGTVLITGGVQGNVNQSQALNSAEIYYPQTKAFVPTAPMNYPRAAHTQTLLPNGNVLIAGGVSSGTYLNSAEIFITTANMFIPVVSSMSIKRAAHSATLMKDGRVMICGGYNENYTLNSCEIFDPQTNTFSDGPNLNYKRHSHTAHLLDDGRVIIFGGNNGSWTVDKVEVSTGGSWNVLGDGNNNEIFASDLSNHSSVLLPNKRILITGGEFLSSTGLINDMAKNFNTFSYYDITETDFGNTQKRMNHSSVLLPSNYVMVVGGWNGTGYIDDVKAQYYLFNTPDTYGLNTLVERKPHISSATAIFDRGDFITVVSTYSNFHSISDGSNSGSGGHNSDIGKPRVVLRGIDNEFMIDLSSAIYVSTYNSTNWNQTLSTITIKVPSSQNELPYGWYYLYVCNTGICSDGYIVQASTPRPTCSITNLQAEESVSTTSIKWNWQLNNVGNSTNGFAVFSASNVFITTVAFPSPLSDPATYYQTGLLPNTPSAIKVGCYNIGGFSDPSTFAVAVSTVYTKANPPKNLRVTYASFDTVDLEWDSDNNPNFTPFRIDISTYPDFSEYSIALSFANNYKDTKYTIRNLEPNWRYYFRVKARNGNGVETVYDTQNPESSTFNNPVSTITVGNIVSLGGTPLNTTSIKWSWNKSGGATGYEVWKFMTAIDPNDPIFKSTIDVSVLLSTTSYPYYTQIDLSTNTSYTVKVRSFKNDAQTGFTTVFGPFSISEPVYTLAAVPAPALPNVFTQVTTGSFIVGWDANGNTISTKYKLEISEAEDFNNKATYDVSTDSTTFPLIRQVVGNLKPNYKYYARVYAINKDNLITNNSADLGYKYTLAQPPKRVYVSSITMSGVTVNWDPGENSTDTIYELRATSVSFESPYLSTPVPFGLGYKDTSYRVNGLWIETTYYFDVSAMNMEGVETARIQTTTPAVTLPGPAGAPPSSISGLTDPSVDITITGNLSDNRPVSLFVPKEAFNSPQPIAIAKLNDNPCGYTFGGSTLTFGLYTNEQPYTPLTFTFDYYSSEAVNASNQPDIHTYKSRVTLARYNPDTGQCLPVKTTIDEGLRKITAEINHFSIYQLIILNPASDLNNIKVFPNPFYPNKPGQGTITIINLPIDSKLTFYTLSGQKVYETTSDTTGTAYWSGKNSDGQFVGSGVYLCVVKSKVGKKIVKVAIER